MILRRGTSCCAIELRHLTNLNVALLHPVSSRAPPRTVFQWAVQQIVPMISS